MLRNILLVDDDSDDRAFFCEALLEVDPEFLCHTSPNGRAALALLNNKKMDTPDLIFLDINMPGLNGWQCLTRLKEHDEYKNVPVIMYSTSSHTEDIHKAQELGAFGFFVKPNGFNDLKKNLEVIASHLRNNSLSSLETDSSLFVLQKARSSAY